MTLRLTRPSPVLVDGRMTRVEISLDLLRWFRFRILGQKEEKGKDCPLQGCQVGDFIA